MDSTESSSKNNAETESNFKSAFKNRLDARIIDYYTIEVDYEYEKKLGENLCEAFVISGLANEKSEIIKNSFDFTPICKHVDCAIFPAMKPSILYKFPHNDTDHLEITNSIASMCFPLGIKLCFEKNEEKISPIKNFVSTITNIYGERLYIYNHFFFVKIPFAKFQKSYEFNPINEYGKLTGLISNSLTTTTQHSKEIKKIEDSINKNLEICFECLNSDDVYLPYCFSLISLYPNASAFEKILKEVNKILINLSNKAEDKLILEIEQLLTNIIYEIPLPSCKSSLCFYLPLNETEVKIYNIIDKKFPCLNYSSTILLEYFSIENIINIHYLILCEQKTIFISPNGEYDLLFKIIEAFLSLIYPLKWENTCIPCLSSEFVKYLQSFMPYIMGIEENCETWIKRYTEEENVYVVKIKDNLVENYSADGKITKMNYAALNNTLPKMPKDIYEYLSSAIKFFCDRYKRRGSRVIDLNIANPEIDFEFRQIFMRSMIMLLDDYKSHTINIDDIPFLDIESFIEKKNPADREFFREFLQNKNFRQFLQLAMTEYSKDWNGYYEEECNKLLIEKNSRKSRTSQIITRISNIFTSNDFSNLHNEKKIEEDPNCSETIQDVLYPYFLSDEMVTSMEEINFYYKKNSQIISNCKGFVDKGIFQFDLKIFKKLFKTPFEFLRKYKILKLNSKPRGTYKYFSMKALSDYEKDEEFSNLDVTKRLRLIKNRVKLQEKEEEEEKIKQNTLMLKQCIRHKQSLLSIISACKNQEELNVFQDQISEMMNDYMCLLLDSTTVIKESFSDVSVLLQSRFARAKFASILFQEKFNKNEKHCLSADSYKQLKGVIFNSLLFADCVKGQFEDVMLITKSMFYYYKNIDGDKEYYIYQDIIKRKGSFTVWKNENFWRFYLDSELDENSQSVSSSLAEEIYVKTILTVVGVMSDLNLASRFIYDCLNSYVQGINLINLDFLIK